MKCCIYSRLFYENPYINYFLEHYLSIGFDKIFLLQGDNISYNLPEKFKDRVVIHKTKNERRQLREYDWLIKSSQMDWCLSIDTDEFLVLQDKYFNIKDFISSKISKFKNLNTFYFRWLNINKYDNLDCSNLHESLLNYKSFGCTYIKTMFRVKDLFSVHRDHLCRVKPKPEIYFEQKILKRQSNDHKLCDTSYTESCLVHLHTRSIQSLVIKALVTEFCDKKISQLSLFKNFIEQSFTFSPEKLLQSFIDSIGPKAEIPFRQANHQVIDIFSYNYNSCFNHIEHFNSKLTDLKLEEILIKDIFKNMQLDFNLFKDAENKLSHLINSKKIFLKVN
jgi:hypothetical protein